MLYADLTGYVMLSVAREARATRSIQTPRRAARPPTRKVRLGRNLTGCTAVVMRLDPRVVIDLLRLKLSNDL